MNQSLRRILIKKSFMIPLAVLCLYTLAGFFLLPRVIGWYAPRFVKEQFQSRLDVGKVRINPFLLTFEANDVSLGTPDEPLAGFKRLFIDFEITRLFKAATFREIRLEHPSVHITVRPDGGNNFDIFIPKHPAAETSDSKPSRIRIDSVLLSDGTIFIQDKRQSQPAHVTLQEIGLNATNISTLPDQSGNYSMSARTPDSETFQCQGQIALIPFVSSGKLSVSAVRFATLWQFMKDSLNLESVSGKMDISTDYRAATGAALPELRLDGFHFGLQDLALKLPEADKDFFELKKMDLEQVRFNLAEKKLQIGKLLVAGGAVNLRIDEAGDINFAQMIRKNTQEKAAQSSPAETTAPKAAPPAPDSLPWTAEADSIDIKDIAFGADNFSRVAPVRYEMSSIGFRFAAKILAGTRETKVSLDNIASELKDARIQFIADTRPIFQTDSLTIDGGMLDMGAHSLTVSRIAMHGGTVEILRDPKGRINLQQLFEQRKSPSEISVPATVKELQPSWTFLVKSFEIDGLGSNLSDLGMVPDKPIVNIQSFSCRLSDVDGKSPMGFEAGFSLKQGGTLAVHGRVDPAAPSVEANLNLKALSLTPFQPYLKSVAAVTLKSAEASLHGDLKYGMKSAGANLTYTGSASLDKVLITEPNVQKALLGWDGLDMPKLKLTLQPDKLDIEKIRISKPTGEVIIAPDHTLNLSRMLVPQAGQTKPKARPESVSKKEKEAFPVRIGKVEIEKGDMVFADLSLKPQFMTRINDLKGEVGGLVSAGDSPSQVRLDGRVDQYGMAKISGKINVFDPGKSTDLSLVFKNVEMTKLTPYSGKFAGRRITSGKLSTDLKYRIQDGKLLGDNQIIVDNLTLGEHVDSPDAVNLPLDLAIALLKDSSGRIDIGLPVSGDLNDPQFSYGQLIWKALVNLLTKIVTSPFRALGSLFGGGNEQQPVVEFDPGSSVLMPPEKEKLQKIADVLKNRPQLKLSIQGHYNPDTDGAEIKAKNLRMAIAGLSVPKGGEKEDSGALDFTEPTTRQALNKMYIEKAGAPAFDALKQSIEKETKNKADIPRTLSEALYKKLLDGETVPAEKLTMLAEDRVGEIIKELETAGGIPSERLAMKSPEPQKSGTPSVDFSLEALAASQ